MKGIEHGTLQALRTDVALQLARFAVRLGETQMVLAQRLGVPQPTLSKIMNGRVADLSLELLLRVAARAGLSMVLQVSHLPEETGAFASVRVRVAPRETRSQIADAARDSLRKAARSMTASERLEAFLEHNQLSAALVAASKSAHRASRVDREA